MSILTVRSVFLRSSYERVLSFCEFVLKFIFGVPWVVFVLFIFFFFS